METLAFRDSVSNETPDLLSNIIGQERDLAFEFITSPEFGPQRQMLKKVALAVSDPEQDAGFLKILIASYIFERIATNYLAKLVNQANLNTRRRKFILTSDEVVGVYERIHGHESIRDKDILQKVIEGVTMPDALEFTESGNTLQLTGIWDSKLGDLTQRTINQRRTYKRGFVQKNLMLHFPEGRTKFTEFLREIKPGVPDKPVNVPDKVKIAYLHPIGSNLSQSGYPRIEVPIQRSTIELLKGMFASSGGADFAYKAA